MSNKPIDFIEQMNPNKKKKVKEKRKWPFLSRKNHESVVEIQSIKAKDKLITMISNYNQLLERIQGGDKDAAAEFNNLYGGGVPIDTQKDYYSELQKHYSMTESMELMVSEENAKKSTAMRIYENVRKFMRYMLGTWGVYNVPSGFNEIQYQAQREASWGRYILDPIAGNIADQLLFFSLGKGIQISSPVTIVDDYIQNLLKDYKFANNQKWDYRRIILDGEMHYFMLPDEKKKTITIERLASMYINEVRYHRGNIVYYYVSNRYFDDSDDVKNLKEGKWYKSARFDEFDGDELNEKKVPANVEEGRTIYTIKYGDSRRGEPYLVRILRWCQIHEELGKDVARLVHEQARILLKKTIYQDNIDNPTAKDRILEAPPGGYMIVAIKGRVDYEFMSAKIDGFGIEKAVRFVRSFLSAGTHQPEYIAFSDASNENYASILESKTPFIVFVEFRQDFFKEEFGQFLRRNLEMAVKEGYIDDTVNSRVYRTEAAEIIEASQFITEELITGKMKVKEIADTAKKMLGKDMENVGINTKEVMINVTFPLLRYDDQLKLSQSMNIHSALGIPDTILWKKMGYDIEEVFVESLTQRKKEQEEEDEDMVRFNKGQSFKAPDFVEPKEKEK